VLLELAGDDDLATLLAGVYLDLAPISLATSPSDDGLAAARALMAHWDAAGIAPEARTGTLGVDPIGTWARTGGALDVHAALHDAADLAGALLASAPQARLLVADGTVWHEAGATDAEELGWTIATAVAEVRAMTAAGIALADSTRLLELRWAATADQFATIAKLRAARVLWARVAEIAGIEPTHRRAFHHADSSRVMLTRYDVWTNALRSTVACFAAAYGGADAITIWPHDSLRAVGGSPLGRRVARNTQTVLQFESNLARVADPAGGSWYVERRTDELARAAWRQLQEIEAAGGIVKAVESGIVHDRLAANRGRRQRAVATRRRPLTGLTEFPDIGEQPPPPVDHGPVTDGASTAFEPLQLHRLADDVEVQRGRADAHLASTGKRPSVFLAALGTPAEHTARATFAKNLFEAGGIVTEHGAPDQFDPAATTLACICSSDAMYRAHAEEAARTLRAAGATTIYLAGRKLGIAGVDEEVGLGSDVCDIIARALDAIGVAR
jgi:methylmalonyl-CoA mutase